MSLRARIILTALAVIAFVNVASVVYFVDRERRAAVMRLHDTIEEDAHLLQIVTSGPLYDGNVAQLGATLDSIFANPDLLEMELKETRGDIAIARKRPAVAQHGERIERDVAVVRGRDELGKVRLAYTTANIEQRLAKSRDAVVLFSLLLLVALSVAIYFLAARLTRPIERLTQAAKAIAEGDLERDIDARGPTELKILGQSFLRMRDAVRQKMADLEETNRQLADEIRQRARAEEMNALLAAVVESTSDAVVTRRPDGAIVSWNSGAVRMFGWTAAEAVGQDISLISPAEFRHESQRNTRCLEQREPLPMFESVRTGKDGRRIQVQVSVSGVYDDEGRLKLVSGIFRDITERKALEVERARLAAIVESSGDAIISRSPDGTVLTWNHAAERMFGYSAAEAVGRHIDFIIPPERQVEVAQKRALLAQSAKASSYDTVRLARDGKRIDVSATQSAILDANGATIGVSLTFRDITERKNAEDALRESEARISEAHEILHDALESAPAAIAVYDTEDKLVAWNTRFKETFVSFNQKLAQRGTEFRTLLREFRNSGLIVAPPVADLEARLLEHRIPTGSREFKLVDGRWFQIREIRTKVGRITSVYTDITALKEREAALHRLTEELESRVAERTAELAAANKDLESFAYSVSHDLRAPLRGIDGFSHLLVSQHGDKLDPEARRLLERIRAGAQRMGHLITDMLELSRVARSAVQSEEVDLAALAQGAVDELRAEAGSRAVEWRIEPGMTVRGDRGLLRIALANLLGNALKYTRDAAPARIECGVFQRSGNRVEIFVRDNGAGFDMAYVGRLFQPFQRLHAAHEFEGSGIGLATVQRVIAKHGGDVRAEAHPGAGATFYFTLPA